MCSDVTSTVVTRLQEDGMIALRADLSDDAVVQALQEAGVALPGLRGFVSGDSLDVAWMSPDELLVICAAATVDSVLSKVTEAFAGLHHMAVPVGGARVRFNIKGPDADLVLARLCPADMKTFPAGEIRRTRLAQIPAAFWRDGADSLSLVCFRSVADYAQGALENAATHTDQVSLP